MQLITDSTKHMQHSTFVLLQKHYEFHSGCTILQQKYCNTAKVALFLSMRNVSRISFVPALVQCNHMLDRHHTAESFKLLYSSNMAAQGEKVLNDRN